MFEQELMVVSMVSIMVAVGVLMSAIVLVVVPIESLHMYVAGSVLQCPSPIQVAVMVSLGNKPSSQVKVMDDPSNVVV